LYFSSLSDYVVASIFVLGLAAGSIIIYSSIASSSNSSLIPSITRSFLATAQTNSDNSSDFNEMVNHNSSSTQQNDTSIVKAYGHFANNQMENGTVTWIQGGLWNLEIDNSNNKNLKNQNMSATFDANFTMIRPDGSLSHNHIISNLTSNNVIFAGNDIVITGVSDIHRDNGTEYEQIPITIHLMGKQVLGLMIDVNKTGGHFSSSNEMYGTLISGIGLDNSSNNNNNTTANGRTTEEANNSSIANSRAQMLH
jgi:hypothetical protein